MNLRTLDEIRLLFWYCYSHSFEVHKVRKVSGVVISTKLNFLEFTFFRLTCFAFKFKWQILSYVKEHTRTISVSGLFNRLQRCVKALWQQFTSCHFLLHLKHAKWPKSNSHLFNIQWIKSYFSQFIFYPTLYKYWSFLLLTHYPVRYKL